MEFAPGGSSFDTAIAGSDAWSHVAARLREVWQEVTPAEMREHYRRSMAEGISNLPETEGLPFGDEEFGAEASGLRWRSGSVSGLTIIFYTFLISKLKCENHPYLCLTPGNKE